MLSRGSAVIAIDREAHALSATRSGETEPPSYISLNGQPPGQKVFLSTIPGDFTVTAVGNLGPGQGTLRFRLDARAFGCQESVHSDLFACRAGGCCAD